MNGKAATAAPSAGREQSCDQCGTSYRARRSTSRYCGPACRKQAQRGVAPVNAQPASVLLTLLTRLDFVGQVGPVNSRDPRPPIYGLTVPREHAFAELRSLYDRKGWGVLTEAELSAELKACGIVSYDVDPKSLRGAR